MSELLSGRGPGLRTRLFTFVLIYFAAWTSISASANDRVDVSSSLTSGSLQQSYRLEEQARKLLAIDPAQAAVLAKNAGDLAALVTPDSRERAVAIATAQWLRGEAALRLNRPAAAKPLLAAAYDMMIGRQSGSHLVADILVSRARLESADAEVQSSLVDYLSAFQIYKRFDDRRHEAVTLQDIGLLYNDAGNYERALKYYDESKATFSGSPILDLSVFNNRADSLAELHRFGEAAINYTRSLKIAESLHSPALVAQVLNNLAFSQIADEQYVSARQNLARGMRVVRKTPDHSGLSDLIVTSAQLSLAENRLDAARVAIDSVLNIRDRGPNSGRDVELHRTAYQIYKALGLNDKALVELEMYQKIDNDHRTLMASANSALMAARFDFDNQNSRIELLKEGQLRRDFSLARLRARQGQIIAISLLVLIVTMVVFFFVYLRTLHQSRDRARKDNLVLNDTNLKLEQALEAKTQFLATTSHEIRTPLNGILGMTEVILADQQASGWIRQRLCVIQDAGQSMRALVDDLLDMSKMDASEIVIQRDVVDLPTLLWEVNQLWVSHAESAGLELLLDSKRAPVVIVEDARRLRQILSNLLSNAVKFTPSGSITVSAKSVDRDGHEQLCIRVLDTGIGIPPESRDLVFEKFTQLDAGVDRKYGGTGLGLSIARSLARAMGGDLTVGPGVETGTAFTLTLPLERVLSGRASDPQPAMVSPTLNGMRVGFVEANPIRQSTLRAALERRVEAVMFTSTTKEMIDIVRVRGVDVAVASAPKGDAIAESQVAGELKMLAAAAQISNVHLVVIVDDGMSLSEIGLGSYGAFSLVRPVSAPRLLEKLEGLCVVDPPLTSLHA